VHANQTIILEVQAQVRELLDSDMPVPIEAVAGGLFLSKSTLQRRLAELETSFTMIRSQVQVDVAGEWLISGASCASAARRAGLSRDHLCRLVSAQTGLQPRQIARACQLARRAERWRRSAPSRAGTRMYAERAEKWKRLERELTQLLAPIPDAGDPLSGWARKLRRSARRPDYRRGAFRARARAERKREQAIRRAQRRYLEQWWADFERTQMIGRRPENAERDEVASRIWFEALDAQYGPQSAGHGS
jgi:AraC-like DNA-binding protein